MIDIAGHYGRHIDFRQILDGSIHRQQQGVELFTRRTTFRLATFEDALQFFQRQLGESGILDALVAKGVQENDTILIGDYQFDYIF